MKIVYAADNSNRINLGCRATSNALRRLIEENNTIVGTITGQYTHMDGVLDLIYDAHLPGIYYKKTKKLYKNNILRKIHRRLLRRCDPSRLDFVCQEPKESIKRFKDCLPANDHLKMFDLRQYDFDAIVFNGEGTMIMTTPPRRDSLVFLMLAQWALDLGKKVYFVNAMFSDCPVSGQNKETIETANRIFSRATLLSCRDRTSLEYVKQYMPDCNPIDTPDALFTFQKYVNPSLCSIGIEYFLPFGREFRPEHRGIRFDRPYLLLSGNSLVIRDLQKSTDCFTELVRRIKTNFDCPLYLLVACAGDHFLYEVAKRTNTSVIPAETSIFEILNILAGASVYVSGRFHPSVMASLGGTPCVFMGSNSHKTRSLQDTLGYDKDEISFFNAFPKESEYDAIIKKIQHALNGGIARRNKIKKQTAALSAQSHSLADKISAD